MRSQHRLLLIAASVLVAAGARLAAAMVDGEVVADPTPTAEVFLDFGGHTCSGTLLTPTRVLTAQHCVIPLDDHFGDDGVLAQAAPGVAVTAGANAVRWDQAFGYVAAGWAEDPTEVPAVRFPALWSFDEHGAPRGGFGDGGARLLAFTGVGDAELVAVTRALDGTVFAAGWAEVGGLPHMLVARLDFAGRVEKAPYVAPDASAPGSGLGFAPAPLGRARAMAIDPASHDVIVVGSRFERGVERWAAARFGADGTPRAAFGYLDTQLDSGAIAGVAIDGGRVIVIGTLGGRQVVAALDPGAAVIVPVAGIDEVRALAVDGAGRVVVVGNDRGRDRVLARRYDAALAPDGGFGTNGLASLGVEPDVAANLTVVGAGFDAQGLVVGVALVWPGQLDAMTIARFTAAGRPDTDFAQGGLLRWSDGDQILDAAALAVTPERTVVVGHAPSALGLGAVAFATNRDAVAAAVTVRLGGTTGTARTITSHPDPRVDVALIDLVLPLVAPAGVRVTGVVDPISITDGAGHPLPQPVTCYGYGRDRNDVTTGALVRDRYVFDGFESPRVSYLATACPDDTTCEAGIQHGDSGGGCVVEDAPSSWRLFGVISQFADRGDVEASWYPSSRRFSIVRGDVLTHWIETTP